jgi:flagellar biosynthetic protein FliQ
MTPEFAVQIIKQTLVTAVWVAAPLLAIGFVVGLVMNLVQIATSLQDSAVSTARVWPHS